MCTSYGLESINVTASCTATFLEVYDAVVGIANNSNVESYWSYIASDTVDVTYAEFLATVVDVRDSINATLVANGHASVTFGDACPSACDPACIRNNEEGSNTTNTTADVDARCTNPVLPSTTDLGSPLLFSLFASAFGGDSPLDFCSSFVDVALSIDVFIAEDLSVVSDCSLAFDQLVSTLELGLSELDDQTYATLKSFVATALNRTQAVAELTGALAAAEVCGGAWVGRFCKQAT